MTKPLLVINDIGVKGKEPWLSRRKAILMTIFCVLFSSIFYIKILTGIITGLQALFFPSIYFICFYFFWRFPRQVLTIAIGMVLWIIIGPGITGIWFWGIKKILTTTGFELPFKILAIIFWTIGPIAIIRNLIKKFGLITISKNILSRRFPIKSFLKGLYKQAFNA